MKAGRTTKLGASSLDPLNSRVYLHACSTLAKLIPCMASCHAINILRTCIIHSHRLTSSGSDR